MDRLLDLLIDTDSLAGLAATTVAIALAGLGLRLVLVPLARRRHRDDRYRRYWAGKLVSYAIAAVAVISLIALWAPFGGRISVILGFATAGIAFVMQEVIGALFGWVNILAGRIYTVGDRIEVGGVRGDVMDISPLRTKVLEIGSEPTADGKGSTWVSARQPTGRVVTVSNRKTFTEPVFNYSAHLEWIWEELAFVVPQDADWEAAETILLEEIRGHAPELRTRGEAALAKLGERYLLSPAEVQPRSYIRLDDGDIEIVGRFVTAVRTARTAKDAITRAVVGRLREGGIPVAYQTYSVDGLDGLRSVGRVEHGRGLVQRGRALALSVAEALSAASTRTSAPVTTPFQRPGTESATRTATRQRPAPSEAFAQLIHDFHTPLVTRRSASRAIAPPTATCVETGSAGW